MRGRIGRRDMASRRAMYRTRRCESVCLDCLQKALSTSVASEAWLAGNAGCADRIGGVLIAARTRSRDARGEMVMYTMNDEVSN
jgi:hypothetical protein